MEGEPTLEQNSQDKTAHLQRECEGLQVSCVFTERWESEGEVREKAVMDATMVWSEDRLDEGEARWIHLNVLS